MVEIRGNPSALCRDGPVRYNLSMDTEHPHRFESKQAARAYARELRNAWPPTSLAAWSRDISERLQQLPQFIDTGAILVYVGARPGELDTRPVIEEALRREKMVFVPITLPTGKMAWSRLHQLDSLVRTGYGLLEPPPGQEQTTPPPGLCIVPGMLFQRNGHRIGFGGGYYDRFLAHHKGMTVGLCPCVCFGHYFPVEAHDMAVATIVTEEEVFVAAESSDEYGE